MTTTRRGFLTGLGAAIVAVALPPVVDYASSLRVLPRIVLTVAPGWPLTFESLVRCVNDLCGQVAALAPLKPTTAERERIAAEIDDALWEIRPVAIQVLVEASFEDMVRGEFAVVERGIGTVAIIGRPAP